MSIGFEFLFSNFVSTHLRSQKIPIQRLIHNDPIIVVRYMSMEVPIPDVRNVEIGNIANDTAAGIEGFRHHVDKISGKVDKVKIHVAITTWYLSICLIFFSFSFSKSLLSSQV